MNPADESLSIRIIRTAIDRGINPIRHATNLADATLYKIEPYVMAADIYAVVPHTGRGGWTWDTGLAGWRSRLIVETLLGLQLEVDKLRLNPRLPRAWETFKMHYRYRDTFYHITVTRAGVEVTSPVRVIVDGKAQPNATIQLVDDRREHGVEARVH